MTEKIIYPIIPASCVKLPNNTDLASAIGVAGGLAPLDSNGKIPVANLPDKQAEIILPSNIYLLKSKDYSLYKTNILNGVDNRGDVDLYAIGLKNYNRQFIANITEDVSIPINGYDNAGNRAILKTLALKAYDNTGITGKTLRVLCIGDSFTDIGQWVNEIYQQLDAAGATVEMIGTTKQSFGDEWLCEGMSGAALLWVTENTYVGYIINVTSADGIPSTRYAANSDFEVDGVTWSVRGTRLTEDNGVYSGKILVSKYGSTDAVFPSSGTATMRGVSVTWDSAEQASWNPFWNRIESKVDFNWYLNKYGFNTPDIICIQFGLNDLAAATDASITNMMTRLGSLINTIHTQLPSTGIVISVPPFDGINLSGSTSGNKNRLDMKYILHKYMKTLCNTYDNSTYNGYVAIAPSYAFVDRENTYTKQEVALNTRFPSVKDVVYTDPLHCNEQGMRQIGDCVVPTIVHMYNYMHRATSRTYDFNYFTVNSALNHGNGLGREVSPAAGKTYYLSDFIPIEGATSIETMALCDNGYCDAIAFYSAQDQWTCLDVIPAQDTWKAVLQPRLLTVPGEAGDLFEGEALTIPQGAKYIRVTSIVDTSQYGSGQTPYVTVFFNN